MRRCKRTSRLWLIIPAVLLALGTFAAGSAAATVVVDFSSQASGTTFGSSDGDSPGDVLFTENGVDVVGREFIEGSFTAFISAEIDPSGSSFDHGMSLNNLSAEFQYQPATQVSFEYEYFGGSLNLGVNGSVVEEGFSFTQWDGDSLGGADISVAGDQSDGTVTLTGDSIEAVRIGGQELVIDNYELTPVPEPASAAMLGLGGLVMLRRRRRA